MASAVQNPVTIFIDNVENVEEWVLSNKISFGVKNVVVYNSL